MQRGFIQIPIFLIAIIIAAVLGGGAYVAYEVAKPAQPASPKETAIEPQATTTVDVSATAKVEDKKSEVTKDNNDSLIGSLKKQVADLTQKVNQPKVETPKTSVVTLPNGAVVEMDANGNIIRTITAAPQQTYTAPAPTSQSQTQAGSPVVLTISLGQATVSQKYNPTCCTYPAYISWTTNLPATSKVFITKTPVDANAASTQVIQSTAGVSTQGFVNISNLAANTEYSYTIEAIAGTQDQKISGTINTNTLLGVVCSQPVITINLSATSLSVYPYPQPYPDYNYDVPVKTDVQIYSNCGFDPSSVILVDSNTDRGTAYNPSVLIGGTGAFGKVSEITAYHNFNSKISDDGKTITFSYPVNIRTLVAGTQYISVSIDHKQVQVAEVTVQ